MRAEGQKLRSRNLDCHSKQIVDGQRSAGRQLLDLLMQLLLLSDQGRNPTWYFVERNVEQPSGLPKRTAQLRVGRIRFACNRTTTNHGWGFFISSTSRHFLEFANGTDQVL